MLGVVLYLRWGEKKNLSADIAVVNITLNYFNNN